MRKTSGILALALALLWLLPSAALQGQEKTQEKKLADTPHISWNQSKHVFGSIEHRKPVTATFTFTNNNKEAVAITKVGVTCGCTAPKYSKEPIKPGEKGQIEIVYDAVAPGFFKKSAKIHFSDGSAKEIEVEGKVVVRRENIK